MIRRLLFVSQNPYLRGLLGGAETSLRDMCELLLTRGVEPVVLCGPGMAPSQPTEIDHRLGYPIHRTASPIEALSTLIEAVRPDAVVLQSGRIAAMVAAAAATAVPLVVYLHNIAPIVLSEILLPSRRIAYLANSRFTAERMRIVFGIESAVLPPLMRHERYLTTSTQRDEVLFSNPIPPKGVEIAFQMAVASPSIPFRFVDNPPVPRAWRQICLARAERAKNIVWSPAIEDVRDYYRRARVVLMPSFYEEGSGRIVSEAQLSGIPAIVSDRGALPDTVGNGGIVVPLHGPFERWVAALHELMGDRPLYARLSAAARSRANDPMLAPEQLVDRFLAIIERHAVDCRRRL